MILNNLGAILSGTVILSLIGIWTAVVTTEPAQILLEPDHATSVINEPFTINVVIKSDVPANAFSGLIEFDNKILKVTAIEYNTSIADLWVTKPWYENGEGTINFAGGTTRAGGFTGRDSLLTITFTPITVGIGTVKITNAQILAHDGLGSELEIKPTADALFTDTSLNTQTKIISSSNEKTSSFSIVNKVPNFDLNNDGDIGLLDISIFMPNLLSNNPVCDFNNDGKVNTTDFSMLLNARTDN